MSKIYEALRQHQLKRTPDVTPLPPPVSPATPSPASPSLVPPSLAPTMGFAPAMPEPAPSPLLGDLLIASREMQALYRSIEPLIAAKECGNLLMFTSAHAGEGKTTVCGGFAAVLAQYFGKSVLILDGDRHHALCRRFGSEDESSLQALARSPEAALQTARRFGVRGAVAAVPVAALAGVASTDSPELELLESIKPMLANTFDYVLIDAPSVAEVSWSPTVGRIADGVILVIEAERTRWPVAMNAKEEFERSGAKVIGAFLNKRKFYIPARVYRFL